MVGAPKTYPRSGKVGLAGKGRRLQDAQLPSPECTCPRRRETAGGLRGNGRGWGDRRADAKFGSWDFILKARGSPAEFSWLGCDLRWPRGPGAGVVSWRDRKPLGLRGLREQGRCRDLRRPHREGARGAQGARGGAAQANGRTRGGAQEAGRARPAPRKAPSGAAREGTASPGVPYFPLWGRRGEWTWRAQVGPGSRVRVEGGGNRSRHVVAAGRALGCRRRGPGDHPIPSGDRPLAGSSRRAGLRRLRPAGPAQLKRAWGGQSWVLGSVLSVAVRRVLAHHPRPPQLLSRFFSGHSLPARAQEVGEDSGERKGGESSENSEVGDRSKNRVKLGLSTFALLI